MDTAVMKAAKQRLYEAIQADNGGNYEVAFFKYRTALHQLLVVLKDEKNEITKRAIRKRIQEYMDRAELLKAGIKCCGRKLEKFIIVLQYDKNGSKRTIVRKPNEYMERAEVYKTIGLLRKSSTASELKGKLGNAIVREKPNVQWSDVAGLEGAKQVLREAAILPVKFPHLFQGRQPQKAILLYGPPGTGKSLIVKAVATEADSSFFSVSSADLVSKCAGENEKVVRALFGLARDQAPCIVFIDEIDYLCEKRGRGQNDNNRRFKTVLLEEMHSRSAGVVVLAATNLPWATDHAVRRGFQKRIYIPLPDRDARTRMFKLNTGNVINSLSERDLDILGEDAEGYSVADISIVVREALIRKVRRFTAAQFFRKDAEGYFEPIMDYSPCPSCPMKLSQIQSQKSNPECLGCGAIKMSLNEVPENMVKIPVLELSDLTDALKETKPSVNPNELIQFEEWTEEFGEEE